MSVSVVIPIYNQWALTHQLLLDIYKMFPQDTKIIVVDDCSPDENVRQGLGWWKSTLLKDRLTVYTNQINAGFLRSCNFGVSKSTTDITILMNNDLLIKDKNVVDKVVASLDAPFTLVGTRLLDQDTGWNKFGDKIFPYLEGWFIAFRTEDWKAVSGFDERYIPFDFEDVDLSTTFLSKGGKLVQVNLDIVHLGGQSIKYSKEREEQTIKNQRKFKDKWLTK